MSDAKPAETPKKKSKLLVIALAGLLLAGGAAGATWFVMGGSHHEASAEKKEAAPRKPLYTTLETFTVNLQDPRGERFAQVGVTLQYEDPEIEVKVKDRLPAIRNEILLLLSSKVMEDLLTTEGKQLLAEQIRERSAIAIGIPVARRADAAAAAAAPGAPAPAAGAEGAEKQAEGAKPAPASKVATVDNPIRGVLFSQFIVQ